MQVTLQILATQPHERKHTARILQDSNRDLVCVLCVAALIHHGMLEVFIFQHLHFFQDLFPHDLLACFVGIRGPEGGLPRIGTKVPEVFSLKRRFDG